MAHTWSPQQQAIFDWFNSGRGNLVVRARAGTGKTTTILNAITYAPETRILLAAFNKSIADELKVKLNNPRAEAKTLHSLGFSFIGRHWRNVKLDTDRGSRLARNACGSGCPDEIVTAVARLAGLAKNCCPTLNEQAIADLADEYDVFPEDSSPVYSETFILTAAKLAATMALEEDGTIDFDDMLYVPVANRWVSKKYDLVVIDEAQDMNAAQLLLAQGACRGRFVVVGDDRQAIYGFRGADSGAIDRLKEELNARELGLTITYRCPKAVVELAAKLVPDYQAAPSAPEGFVSDIGAAEMMTKVEPGDFVLSRKNAPLATLCLALLRSGKPAKITGRDVAKQLMALVKKLGNGGIVGMLGKLTKWEERHVKRAQKLPEERIEAKVRSIQDIAETIRALADGCSTIAEMTTRMNQLFVDDTHDSSQVITLSSIHKAKGRERDRVFLYVDTLYPGGKRGELEEQNLEYVAVTRAKKELYLVHGF